MRTNLNDIMWWRICVWHWILNPGLAVNEMVLGTRLPKNIIIDDQLGTTLQSQQLIICQHCGHEMHYKDMNRNVGFGLWFGMFCPQCRARIPCIMNALTTIVACVTAPVWYPFWIRYRERYIDYCIRRMGAKRTNPEVEKVPR